MCESTSCCFDFSQRLPAELLVNVLRCLSPRDLYLSAAHVNRRWRSVVRNNLRRLPLVPVHCSVDVMDMDVCSSSADGTHPMIQYTFTVFDKTMPDYKHKLRQCKRGNANWSTLWISHRLGAMDCEWDRDDTRPEKADIQTVKTLLKYMDVDAMRFEVRKQGRKTVARLVDERFAHALEFCEIVCGRVNPRSILLSSRSPYFPWCFGPISQKRLISFGNIRSLVLENMTAMDCFGQGKVMGGINLSRTQNLQLRMDATHKQEIENTLWVELDGEILFRLLKAHERCLDFTAYPDVPQAITSITAEDMCTFIKGWRSQISPWIIRNILFNSTVTISEFRTVASRMGLFHRFHLQDIPYCRFRTFHPSDPNVVLELGCYGNGNATQWSIRSGYPNPKKR